MLLELFYRDWLLNRRMLFISYGIFLAFEAFASWLPHSPQVWLIFACIYSSFLAVTIFLREDRFQALGWTCTLPLTRRDLVRARYIEAWAIVLVTMAAAIGVCAIMPASKVDVSIVLQPTNLLVGALVVTVIVSLMLPFTIRLGFMGMLVFLVGIQVLGMLALVAAQMFRGPTSAGVRPIAAFFGGITDLVIALRFHLGAPAFFVAALGVLGLVNYAAYHGAVWLFARREL